MDARTVCPTPARRVDPRATPILWVTGGLLAGQLAALALAGPHWGWAALGGAGLLGTWRWRIRYAVSMRAAGWRALGGPLALALLAAALGHAQLDAMLRPRLAADDVRLWAGAPVALRGRVEAVPASRRGRTRLLLAVDAARRGGDWRPARGRIQVTVRELVRPWAEGDGFEAVLQLRRPRNFGNPGEFDYEAFLARRGIAATGFAASDAGWRRSAATAPSWDAPLRNWRREVARTIRATLPGDTGAIVAALLIGELAAVDPAVRARYVRAGVSHVLSISGLHVALVAGGSFWLGRWLLARSPALLLALNVPKLAVAASLVPVLLYGAIAGANVATVRAELMALLVATGLLLERPRDWIAPLCAAAAAISLSQPGALCEISFQLSFAAVLALALGMPRLTARWQRWEEAHLVRLRGGGWRWLRWLALSQAVTLCAWLGTAPLTAWHFNQVSLIAPLANPIVVPLLGVVAVGGGLVATLAVALAPPLAVPLFHVVGVAVRVADAVVAWCAAIPGASVRVVTPSPLELACLYALLLAPLLATRGARRAVAAIGLAVLAVDAGAWGWERFGSRVLRVTFLSVGHGDCAVVELPRGPVLVIDGGGLSASFDVGERIVGPFLWRRKIRRVDALVLSHADFDHFGGLTFLARSFAPAALWWNGLPAPGARFAELDAALGAAGVARRALARGDRLTLAGVAIDVLHPPAGAAGGDNDRSLTLRLAYGGTALLFPGDLEAAGEAVLVAAHGAGLRSAVLKVPHHGSRTSSGARLLDAVRPALAVVSVGSGQRFQLPAADVVERYRRAGVDLWRTDLDGAVTVRIGSDGALAISATRRPRPRRLAVPRGAHTLDRPETRSLKRRRHDIGADVETRGGEGRASRGTMVGTGEASGGACLRGRKEGGHGEIAALAGTAGGRARAPPRR